MLYTNVRGGGRCLEGLNMLYTNVRRREGLKVEGLNVLYTNVRGGGRGLK